MRVRFAVPAPLLFFLFFRFVLRVASVVVALMPRVAVLLLFLIRMTLLVVGFEPLILGLYGGVALGAVTLSVCLELFDGLDYFFFGLQPVRIYKPLSEVLWHLPPQLVVEVILFHRCQERVLKALQVSVKVDYRPSLRIPFGFLVAVIGLRYACFFRS